MLNNPADQFSHLVQTSATPQTPGLNGNQPTSGSATPTSENENVGSFCQNLESLLN